MNSDGEVRHEANPHASVPHAPLRTLQLLIRDPLQPRVEEDALGVLVAPGVDCGARTDREFLGPGHPSVGLGDRAPRGVVLEGASFPHAEGLKLCLTPGRPGRGEHLLERG